MEKRYFVVFDVESDRHIRTASAIIAKYNDGHVTASGGEESGWVFYTEKELPEDARKELASIGARILG